MPRTGMNPARGQFSSYRPSRITLAMLTYLPDPSGYFRDRFDVICLSLESLVLHAPAMDLMVFDNGSCPQLSNYLVDLRTSGKISFLMLSKRNIGKIGALQLMFQAAPGEFIAYSDDDIFFLPGWLEACMKIMDAYPKVGMVSGHYARMQMTYGIDSTMKFVRHSGVQHQSGRFWPDEHERHFVDNYGGDHEKYNRKTRDLEDMRLRYKNVDALVSAQHMQFVTPRKVILEALPRVWSGRLMGQMKELDSAVDRLGFLRLSTPEPVTRFIGNMVGHEMAQEAQQHGQLVKGKMVVRSRHPLRFLLRSGWLNAWLWKLYNHLFDLLNSREKGG